MTKPDGPAPPPADMHRPQLTVTLGAAQPTVTGCGFLPGSAVTIRVIEPDDIVGYFGYSADVDGTLEAPLPPTLPHGTLTISATDERPDPADDTEPLWTDSTTIRW